MKNIWLYLALLMIPLYGFWIIPQARTVKTHQQSLAALEQETNDYQAKIKQLKDLDKLLSDERYEGVLARIPSKLEQAELIVQLKALAEKTGFVFDGLTFTRGQDPVLESSRLQVNFSVRGRANNFANFLKAIENNPRFMGLSSFAYSTETINNIDIVHLSVPLYALSQSSHN